MKNRLEIEFDTTMDIKLVSTWRELDSLISWIEFVYTLPHIVSVVALEANSTTIIEFDSEENRNWFVLRWS